MEVITIIITIIIKEELRWEVAEKVKHPDPSLPEALLVLVRSGSGQVCGFDKYRYTYKSQYGHNYQYS